MSAHLCSWDAVGMSIVDVLAAWSRAPAVGARLVLLVGVPCSCSSLPGRPAGEVGGRSTWEALELGEVLQM